MVNRHASGCVAAALAMVLASTPGGAQVESTITAAARKGSAIVDAAIAAHGGLEELARAHRIRVTLQGRDIWRNQSVRVHPPYDERDASLELLLDLPASRMVVLQHGAFPGDLRTSARRVTDGDRAHRVFDTLGLHRVDRAQPVANQTFTLYSYLPQLALLAAHGNRAELRSLGSVRLTNGAVVDAVSISTPTGPLTLGFDPSTKWLRAYLEVHVDALTGDAALETEFLDYRRLNGVMLPGRRVTWVAGERTQDVQYTAAIPEYVIPAALLDIPASSRLMPSPPTGDPARELAPGVWSLRQAGTHVLAVAFKDHVVVVDAPSRISREIMTLVAQVMPGKPIRYVVPTHHHDDHSSGVRDYVAAGVTVVTTPGNRTYFQRMADAHSTLSPDEQARVRRPAIIETISGDRRVFTDGTRTLEVHNLGPNEHAEDLLVAWIPDAGIVYEADMLTTAPNGDVTPGANMKALGSFADAIARRGWKVRQFAGTHHPPVPATVLTEILAQPMLRRPAVDSSASRPGWAPRETAVIIGFLLSQPTLGRAACECAPASYSGGRGATPREPRSPAAEVHRSP